MMSAAPAFPTRSSLAILAVVGLWLALFWRGPLINDVAWHLWIGERINGGARLYTDILEVNPPLWFWVGTGVEGLSRLLGLAPFHGLLLLFAGTASLSMALSLSLTANRIERVAVIGGTLGFLLVSSPYALGQREQFAFLCALPYILLAARRGEQRDSPFLLAAVIGAFASAGLLLKPHFLLVPALLEAWVLLRTRRLRIRPELVALGFAGLGYAAAILWCAPAYLTTMLPLIRSAYDGYDNDLAGLLLGPDVVAPVFLLTGSFLASRGEAPAALKALLIGGAAFLAAGLWQFKGFGYHFLPALGCALAALPLTLRSLRAARAPVVACMLTGLFLVAATMWRESSRGDHAAAVATAGLPPGSAILALSESASVAWPLVAERGYVWPSRHMAHWMLAKVWASEAQGQSSPALQKLGRDVVREAAQDIQRSRPAMLLFDRRCDHASGGIVDYYRSDPAFAAAMNDYVRVGEVEYLTVYRRRS